jgi:p21-activated kinase 1
VSEAPMRALFLIVTNGIPPITNPETRSPEFLDFLSKCLCINPSNRASAEELLHHEFIEMACDVQYIPPLIALAEELASQEEFNDF